MFGCVIHLDGEILISVQVPVLRLGLTDSNLCLSRFVRCTNIYDSAIQFRGFCRGAAWRYQLSGDCNRHVLSSPPVGVRVSFSPFGFMLAVRINAPSIRCLLCPLALSFNKNTRYAKTQYTLESGNGTTVAKHKHATVSLEQQLTAISKQAPRARHESFTTAVRQTQFGSCDPVPRLYLTPPQIDRPSVLRD